MLSPDALRVLNALGVYEKIRDKGYNFEILEFKNDQGQTTERYWFGEEKEYGYKALRVHRQVIIDELLTLLQGHGVQVKYDTKFSHVLSESPDSVTFAFADGTTRSASLLIGADGIHSTVRRYIYPDLQPKFSGFFAVSSTIPASKIRRPDNYYLPATMLSKAGAFVLVPQNSDGSDLLVGTQRPYPEQTREGWDKLVRDKDELLAFLQKGKELWPDVVQSAIEAIAEDKQQCTIWPFYGVPKLDRWISEAGKVVILGDAAHVIPPTAGQSVNQA